MPRTTHYQNHVKPRGMHLKINHVIPGEYEQDHIEYVKADIITRLANDHLIGLLNEREFHATEFGEPEKRIYADFIVLTADDARDILDLIQDYEGRQKVKRILSKDIEPLRIAEL